MFKLIGGEVVSDKGDFRIRLAKDRISYIENNAAYGIEVEDLVEPYRMVIYTNSIKLRGKPSEQEKIISPQKKNEIINNTTQALDFLKIKYELSKD